MRYPITIEPGNDTTAWGVVVPDLPGCFSAGDTLEDAMIQAEEAITGWIEAAIDDGQDIPAPSHIESLRTAHPEFEGWLWALVKIDPAMLDDTLERVNISLPRRVLHRLDARARTRHKGLQAFFERGSKAGIQAAHTPKLARQLARLDQALQPQDMNLPGWALHSLQGSLAGHWSVSVNGNWRMTFTFEGVDAVLVDYQDYH